MMHDRKNIKLAIQFCLRYVVLFLVIERRLDGWADVKNGVRYMGIVNWRQVTQDRDGWRRDNGEAFVFLGQWRQRIRRRLQGVQ